MIFRTYLFCSVAFLFSSTSPAETSNEMRAQLKAFKDSAVAEITPLREKVLGFELPAFEGSQLDGSKIVEFFEQYHAALAEKESLQTSLQNSCREHRNKIESFIDSQAVSFFGGTGSDLEIAAQQSQIDIQRVKELQQSLERIGTYTQSLSEAEKTHQEKTHAVSLYYDWLRETSPLEEITNLCQVKNQETYKDRYPTFPLSIEALPEHFKTSDLIFYKPDPFGSVKEVFGKSLIESKEVTTDGSCQELTSVVTYYPQKPGVIQNYRQLFEDYPERRWKSDAKPFEFLYQRKGPSVREWQQTYSKKIQLDMRQCKNNPQLFVKFDPELHDLSDPETPGKAIKLTVGYNHPLLLQAIFVFAVSVEEKWVKLVGFSVQSIQGTYGNIEVFRPHYNFQTVYLDGFWHGFMDFQRMTQVP